MKLSGNRLIESIVDARAKNMVDAKGRNSFLLFKKSPKDAVFALITTAGVHLKTQGVFDVEAGDPTVRFIPSNMKQ